MLEIRAGARAREIIADEGFNPSRVKVLAGASGGPKWLVLSGIDRVIPGLFKGRREPLFTIGSSIGAWLFAALAQKDPVAAIETFEYEYIEQRYTDKPSPSEVTEKSYKILDAYLSEKGIRYALNHPFMRMNIITARAKGFTASEKSFFLGTGFLSAVLLNAVHRPMLAALFQRVVFSDVRTPPPFASIPGFSTQYVSLADNNLRSAVMASGSIPFVMEGIRDIPHAPKGIYRDGGVIDYHMDIPFLPHNDGLVFYPHFNERMIPGWLDKSFSWRKPSLAACDNTILVYPSRKFIDSLPGGKIPDRKDFYTYKGRDAERIRAWNTVVKKGKALGEELGAILSSPVRLKRMVKPL